MRKLRHKIIIGPRQLMIEKNSDQVSNPKQEKKKMKDEHEFLQQINKVELLLKIIEEFR